MASGRPAPQMRQKPPPVPGHGVNMAPPTQANSIHNMLSLADLDKCMSDNKAKTVLKEAVDAVVNSFAKHTHGYGRGKIKSLEQQ